MDTARLLSSFADRRSLWRAMIIMVMLAALLFPQASSNVSLAQGFEEDLLGSDITASPRTVAYGEEVTFTVALRNSGSSRAVAQLTVALPPELDYVDGSATGGGTPNDNAVSWKDIPVPAGSSVSLTLKATDNERVSADKQVVAVAAIMSEHMHFMRFATVTLTPSSGPPPPPTPSPKLVGSYKSASRHILASGEELTYTILLHNSGAGNASVDVTDELPSHVNYVSGSASNGGTYDSGARTVSWKDIGVPSGDEKSLSFRVTAKSVNGPVIAINIATIAVGGDSFERSARVLVVPEWPDPDEDRVPPRVDRVTIADRDVLTNRSVTLHITADDDKGTTKMYVREWQLVTAFPPHWEVVQSSGWVDYQADYSWRLGDESGTHYVGVWVSDGANHISWLGGRALDFASLLLPDESLSQGAMVPYLVYYRSGESVSARLTPSSGDADLYVWFPGQHALPDRKSVNSGTSVDQVSFTTPRSGIYLFLVHAYTAATYDLSIAPAGGPQAFETTGLSPDETSQVTPNDQVTAQAKAELTAEPVLVWSGLDPLDGEAIQAPGMSIYLPIVFR